MIDLNDTKDRYQSHFARLEKGLSRAGALPSLPIRKAAFARFAELGFPTTREEEWRFTNVSPIADTAFEVAGEVNGRIGAHDIAPFLFGTDIRLLVFLNGLFAPHLSTVRSLPWGITATSFSAATVHDEAVAEAHLARHAGYDNQAFTALNTALTEDGALIRVGRECTVETPIHLLFVSTGAGQPTASHPRTLIVLEESSQATIIESYVGFGSETYFTNAVTEIVAGENAVVDHYKIVQESSQAYHVAALHIHQERDSNVTSHTITSSGSLVRNDINALLDGEGCDTSLNGMYVVGGQEHVDNHLVVEHARPHCNSREFFKGVLDGHGRGIFSGRIIVRKGAQKTDAKQTNMSLLLSEDAQVESKPQLEIFADDVKCTHGATIGQLSDEAIFYLRSRGISHEAARNLLVYAFARESLESIRIESLRSKLDRQLHARLPHGQLVHAAS